MNSEALHSSIQCVVAQLQRELDELVQRKADIKLRIRGLRRRLSSVQREWTPETSRARYRKSENLARRAQAFKMRQLQQELHRACRIAFLELGGAATPDALHSAIARRGSFSFAEINETPLIAIARTLAAMAKSGEATCNNNGSQPRWTHHPKSSPFSGHPNISNGA